jgi:M6 family metalloprotease-like protein
MKKFFIFILVIISVVSIGCQSKINYIPVEENLSIRGVDLHGYFNKIDIIKINENVYFKAYKEVLDNLGIFVDNKKVPVEIKLFKKPEKDYFDPFSRDFFTFATNHKTVDISVDKTLITAQIIENALYLPIELFHERNKIIEENNIYNIGNFLDNLSLNFDSQNYMKSYKTITEEGEVYINDKFIHFDFFGGDSIHYLRGLNYGYYDWGSIRYEGGMKNGIFSGYGRYKLNSGYVFDSGIYTNNIIENNENIEKERKLIIIFASFNDLKVESEETYVIKEVNEYYSKYNIHFELIDSISVNVGVNHPDIGKDLNEFDQNILELSLNKIDEKIDFSTFDSDKDGVLELNEVTFINVWAGNEYNGIKNNSVLSNYSKAYSLTNKYDDKIIEGSIVTGEKGITPGIIAHELGHTMGLVDLYDTFTNEDQVGMYSLMSSGYSVDPISPIDPFSQYSIGLIDKEFKEFPITLDDLSKVAFLKGVNHDEQVYYILEKRDSKLIVWDINENNYNLYKAINTVNTHPNSSIRLFGVYDKNEIIDLLDLKVVFDDNNIVVQKNTINN